MLPVRWPSVFSSTFIQQTQNWSRERDCLGKGPARLYARPHQLFSSVTTVVRTIIIEHFHCESLMDRAPCHFYDAISAQSFRDRLRQTIADEIKSSEARLLLPS
jgi:hypothetical protein